MDDPVITAALSADIELLRACTKKDNLLLFKEKLKTYMVTEPCWKIFKWFDEYFNVIPTATEISPTDFILWARVNHGVMSEVDTIITTNIFDPSAVINTQVVNLLLKERILKELETAVAASDYKEISIKSKELEEFDDSTSSTVSNGLELVAPEWDTLLTNQYRSGGLHWRLEDLNKSVGPLNKGDLVIIGKRPETGGTSFLASELTHMVATSKCRTLFINNEETDTKIMGRLICSALGIDYATLRMDVQSYFAEYKKLTEHQIDIVSKGTISIKDVEALLAKNRYGLIAINVLEKLTGLGQSLEDYQRLEKLGQWARKVALDYGPVLAVVQADASAQGVKYLDQSMLYKSKTGLQGEADLLLMIGRSDNPTEDDRRFIHVAKNKLPGDDKTIPALRHLQTEVSFNQDTGRYSSIMWK